MCIAAKVLRLGRSTRERKKCCFAGAMTIDDLQRPHVNWNVIDPRASSNRRAPSGFKKSEFLNYRVFLLFRRRLLPLFDQEALNDEIVLIRWLTDNSNGGEKPLNRVGRFRRGGWDGSRDRGQPQEQGGWMARNYSDKGGVRVDRGCCCCYWM
jgi:hypothetical protein